MESKCKKPFENLKSVQIINMSDCAYENGTIRVKRKYGKFQRLIIKVDMNNLKQYAEDEK